MGYFKVGEEVEVARDIYRMEEMGDAPSDRDLARVSEIESAVEVLAEVLRTDKSKVLGALYWGGSLISWRIVSYLEGGGKHPSLIRGVSRKRVLYASEGETGTVKELFRPEPTGGMEVKPWCAKVVMGDGTIKTFRLTSLRHMA